MLKDRHGLLCGMTAFAVFDVTIMLLSVMGGLLFCRDGEAFKDSMKLHLWTVMAIRPILSALQEAQRLFLRKVAFLQAQAGL